MKTAIEEALSNLKVMLRETNAQATIDSMPVIAANPTQMVQLWQNLISNAVKFRKPEVRPKVHVSSEQKPSEWIFSIRDNGIGIEPQYYDRIFDIFQRLQSDYEGTGIGLAVCKKIIDFHKGRIWIESDPGQGTTFYFTIPIELEGEQYAA